MALIKPEGQVLSTATVVPFTETGTANTILTSSVAAAPGGGLKNVVHYVEAHTRDASNGSQITVELKSGSTVIWEGTIGVAQAVGTRTGVTFSKPIECAANEALTLVSAAGGASCIVVHNVGYSILPSGQ